MTQIVDDTLDPATETALAKRLYNGVWAVLEKPDRSPEDADALINMAHASRYHWGNVGTPQHVAIGEWQIARVYSELGRGEPAVFHARRALAIADGAEVDSWLTASAYEGLARAYASQATAPWRPSGRPRPSPPSTRSPTPRTARPCSAISTRCRCSTG